MARAKLSLKNSRSKAVPGPLLRLWGLTEAMRLASIAAMGRAELKHSEFSGVLVTAIGVDACRDLFSDAGRVTYAPRETVFSVGDPGHSLILIQSGRVEVSTTSLSGRKSVIAFMGPGEILGEIAALDGGERSADVVAASRVEGLVLARENVLSFIAARPDFAERLIVELCRKVRNASDMFAAQSIVEGEPRLARGLLRIFDKWGVAGAAGTTVLEERFSQQDIGEFTGLARENVNRQIRAWSEDGILRADGRTLVLVDRRALEERAD